MCVTVTEPSEFTRKEFELVMEYAQAIDRLLARCGLYTNPSYSDYALYWIGLASPKLDATDAESKEVK